MQTLIDGLIRWRKFFGGQVASSFLIAGLCKSSLSKNISQKAKRDAYDIAYMQIKNGLYSPMNLQIVHG